MKKADVDRKVYELYKLSQTFSFKTGKQTYEQTNKQNTTGSGSQARFQSEPLRSLSVESTLSVLLCSLPLKTVSAAGCACEPSLVLHGEWGAAPHPTQVTLITYR